MQVLMVTYMIKKLGFADTKGNLVWGAAAALIYATPAIGGWVGDKLLGTRRTMLTGAVVLGLGYAMLWIPSDSAYLLYVSLGVIIVGNGFFKPNAGNLVRKIYEGDDTKIDSAFTIYYMAVNIGSTISMLLTPWIRDVVAEQVRRRVGLAYRLRRLRDRPGAGPDQLRADAPHAGAHRLAAGREAGRPQARRRPARGCAGAGVRVPPSSCRTSRWRACASTPPAW